MKKYTWCNDELVDALNKLGYVHFVTKSSMTKFIEGRPFFYDEDNRTYGYVGFITQDHLADAYKNRDYIINKIKELIENDRT